MTTTQRAALVTGGSQGIGEAICHRLAQDGYHVFVASRRREKVDAVAEAIRQTGRAADGLELDVADVSSFKDKVRQIVDQVGGIHVLVNNAGITDDNLMLRIKPDSFDAVVQTNLRGSFFLAQACLRRMMRQKWGRIINISSVVGLMGNVGQANYAASKAGMIGVTKSLAKEVGSRGITVNAIAPGYIETEMTHQLNDEVRSKFLDSVPLGRFGQPDDVAAAVSYLAGESAGYVTGQVLTVDGGLRM